MVIDQNVAMIVVHRVIVRPVVPTEIATQVHLHDQVLIAQQVVHTETEIHVRHHDQVLIVANAVTVRAIHDQVQTVEIVVQVQTAQQVAPMVIVIPVRHRVHHQIAANAVTVHVIHVQPRAHLPIVHVAKILMVAIAHAQAMTAMHVHLAMIVAVRVTANAVADQIVPEVVSPMIAKNGHVVALAKSA
jgi:hypothetical protein